MEMGYGTFVQSRRFFGKKKRYINLLTFSSHSFLACLVHVYVSKSHLKKKAKDLLDEMFGSVLFSPKPAR
jgi:hypothetical protein